MNKTSSSLLLKLIRVYGHISPEEDSVLFFLQNFVSKQNVFSICHSTKYLLGLPLVGQKHHGIGMLPNTFACDLQ